MLSGVDPIGKIQEIYREGHREVPYALFMNVFNALLEDQTEIIPREPSEELAEKFRAACMAAHAGVSDPEGRGPERVREFLEHVYPVWQDRLTDEQFAKFEEIVGGQLKERFGGGPARPQPEAPEPNVEPEETTGESSALLERLGIGGDAEEEEEAEPAAEEEPPAPAEPEPATEESAVDALLDEKIAQGAGGEEEEAAEIPMLHVAEEEPPEEIEPEPVEEEEEGIPELILAEQMAEIEEPTLEELLTEQQEAVPEPEPPAEEPPQTFESVDALAEAIKSGGLAIKYTTRDEDQEWVRYALGEHEVSVKVVRTDERIYVVLRAEVGHGDVPAAEQQVDMLAADMLYVRMADYAYLREDEDAVYTLKVGPHTTSLASGVPADAGPGDVLLELERLHRDLGELVEQLES
jgi:hypothetical protein